MLCPITLWADQKVLLVCYQQGAKTVRRSGFLIQVFGSLRRLVSELRLSVGFCLLFHVSCSVWLLPPASTVAARVCTTSLQSHLPLCYPVDCSQPGSSVHGLPCLSPGGLPDPGIKPEPLLAPALQADSLPLSH